MEMKYKQQETLSMRIYHLTFLLTIQPEEQII